MSASDPETGRTSAYLTPEESRELQEYRPDHVLRSFSKFPIVMFFVVAFALHVVLIGGSSTRFIRDTYIDPEGAKVRAEAAKVAAEAEDRRREEAERKKLDQGKGAKPGDKAPAKADPAKPTKPADGKTADPTAKPGDKPEVGKGEDLPDAIKNSPQMKKITDTAKPEEIPKAPNDDRMLKDMDKLSP